MLLTDLMALKCWIPFMLVPDGDKVYKRPSVDGVRPARWKRESDTLLTTYADAIALKERTPGLAGVGLSITSGIAIIDLDKCYDSGTIKPAASSIIDTSILTPKNHQARMEFILSQPPRLPDFQNTYSTRTASLLKCSHQETLQHLLVRQLARSPTSLAAPRPC